MKHDSPPPSFYDEPGTYDMIEGDQEVECKECHACFTVDFETEMEDEETLVNPCPHCKTEDDICHSVRNLTVLENQRLKEESR
jgi:hypothetical protein